MLLPSLRNRGGFFSDYYLGAVFGETRRRGLVTPEVERKFKRLLRLTERLASGGGGSQRGEAFARSLLGDIFEYHLGAGSHAGESIARDRVRGLFATAEDEARGQGPLLLAYVGQIDEDLDAGTNRKQTPTYRLAQDLARRQDDLRYGLLVTGERLRLIRRDGDGPRGAYLELDLTECVDREDQNSLAAAIRLFGRQAFLPDSTGEAPIARIERESREQAQRVSEDLKEVVFESAQRLVQALREAGATGSIVDLRDAALIGLYRLLFILYAEARDPRLLANAIYRDAYSLDALVRDLTTKPESFATNRHGLWDRLLGLFAIHRQGLPRTEALEPIPARGGELFDDSTPAGRVLQSVRLPDRTVADLLLDLGTTKPRRGVGRERIAFRELDIEQLGAVYEGLLEYEPRLATETLIEVRVQGKTFALPPRELVRLVNEKSLPRKSPGHAARAVTVTT